MADGLMDSWTPGAPAGLTDRSQIEYSDALLSGKLNFDSLPDNVKMSVQDYWRKNPDALNPNMSQGQVEQLNQRRQQAFEKSVGTGPISVALMPVEWVGSKLYWVYSNTVSPAFSAATLTARRFMYGSDASDPTGVAAIGDIWNEAHHISPGQSLWMLGLNQKEARDRGISPNQIASGPEGEKAKKDYFGQGVAKYATGTADFMVNWFLDPTVIAGKLAKVGRAAAFIKPTVGEVGTVRAAARMAAGAARGENVTFAAAKVGKSNLPKYERQGIFDSMVDDVEKIKAQHGDAAAAVLREHFPSVRRSADGDVLARALASTKTADETADVLKISVGDKATLDKLMQSNATAAGMLKASKSRLSALNTDMAKLTVDQRAGLPGQILKGYIDDVSSDVSKLNDQTQVVDNKLAAFNTLDNLNYNRVTSLTGTNARNALANTQLKQGGAGRLIYNNTYVRPIRIMKMYGDIKPSHYLDVHDANSYREFDASLREIKWLAPIERQKMVSQYINSTPEARGSLLQQLEQNVTKLMADRYGIEESTARGLYADFADRRNAVQTTGRGYSTATVNGMNVAEISSDGSIAMAHPILTSQLANNHALMDFGLMDKVISRHGKAFEGVFRVGGDVAAKTKAVTEVLDSYWKFAQLARVGYGPRAMSDDFMGQVARFGGAMMAARTADGAARLVRGAWHYGSRETDALNIGANVASVEQIDTRLEFLNKRLARVNDPAAQKRLQDQIDDALVTRGEFEADTARLHNKRANTMDRRPHGLGTTFSGAYEGTSGALFKDLAAGERNASQLFGRQADWLLRTARSGDWTTISATKGNESKHMAAWLRQVNDQLANDALARRFLSGDDLGQATNWLRNTPEGQAHKRALGLAHMPSDELAERVQAHVDHLLDPNIAGMDVARASLLNAPLKAENLEDLVKPMYRPDVNAEQLRNGLGGGDVLKMADSVIGAFYKVMNQLPSAYHLRHPLFAQLYRASIEGQIEKLRAQGVSHIDEPTRQLMEGTARKAALRDVKQFTFTMDHETKLAYMMRYFSAFFPSQQESWNRWARIVADKPQTIAHGTQVYGSPIRLGMVTDTDGNVVQSDGTVTDEYGVKKLIPKSDMKIGVQIPDYLGGKALNKFIGADEHASWQIPMNSLNLVLQNDPVWLPSAGPLVQIAANSEALKSPEAADMFKKLGILPYGPKESWTDLITPASVKRDVGPEADTYQSTLFKMMQVEDYKYQSGMRDKPPTWSELKERTDTFFSFKSIIGFTMPFSVQSQDPYQFFRDEYSRMGKVYGEGASDAFYQKYGDSLYAFAKSNSISSTGVRPTAEGWRMSKYYQDLIDQMDDPRYASVIVGDEGEGEYSQGAYYLQGMQPAQTGSRTMAREKLDAREGWEKAQVALGWQRWTGLTQGLQAELFARGLTSYSDPRATDLKRQRDGIVATLTSPTLPDGSENPFYNKQWEKEFTSLDKNTYSRRAQDFAKIATDPIIMAKSVDEEGNPGGVRSEMARLRIYLTNRMGVTAELARRKRAGGSDDITAKANTGLRRQWQLATDDLIQQDTKFGYLHSRWFATDMGYAAKED